LGVLGDVVVGGLDDWCVLLFEVGDLVGCEFFDGVGVELFG